MHDELFNEKTFDRATADLRRVVQAIAGRYKLRGGPLTWRLVHDIETEALSDLGLRSRYGEELLAFFARPADYDYPFTSAPVQVPLGHHVPLVVWLVLDVYDVAAIPLTDARQRVAREVATS